ncbi:MAG: hypothetical protein QXU54_00190 [Candidatus Micrarchaeia archaeon]
MEKMDILWGTGLLVFLISFLVGFAELPYVLYTAVSSISPLLLAVICAIACYIFWSEYRPQHLYLFMIAMFLWALGETLWFCAQYIEDVPPEYADLLWLAGYPFLVFGFVDYIRKNNIRADSIVLATISAISIVYITVLLKYLLPVTLDFEGIVNLVYPIGDVILLALSFYIVLGQDKNNCFGGIARSMLLFTIFDSLYTYSVKIGAYNDLAPFIDPIYVLAYLVFLYAVYSRYRDVAGSKEIAVSRVKKRARQSRKR